jgi:hypothetical protein
MSSWDERPKRVRKAPDRSGMVDITDPTLSFATPKGGIAAADRHEKRMAVQRKDIPDRYAPNKHPVKKIAVPFFEAKALKTCPNCSTDCLCPPFSCRTLRCHSCEHVMVAKVPYDGSFSATKAERRLA